MFLKIDDTYAIGSDTNSWHILKKRTRKDRKTKQPIEEWEAIRWYGTFEQTLNGLGQHMLRASNAQSFADALVDLENIVAKLSQALPSVFEIVCRGKDHE